MLEKTRILTLIFFFIGNKEILLAKRDVLVCIKHEHKEHQVITNFNLKKSSSYLWFLIPNEHNIGLN